MRQRARPLDRSDLKNPLVQKLIDDIQRSQLPVRRIGSLGAKFSQLHDLCKEISLAQIDENIALILKGKQRGRVLVNLDM